MSEIRQVSPGARIRGSRRSVSVSREQLVRQDQLLPDSRVVVCSPTVAGLDAREWLASSGGALARLRDEHGAVLLRDFTPLDADGVGEFAAAFAGDLRDYDNRSTPRTRVNDGVFTSTEYPADQSIPLHNEMSYTASWPHNAMYGDGSPLNPNDLDQIRAAYGAEEIAFPGRAGDVVIVDNEQFAHDRRPYSGKRSVLVAMA